MSYFTGKKCERLFDIIKNRAIDDEDEGLANAQMIYKHFLSSLSDCKIQI